MWRMVLVMTAMTIRNRNKVVLVSAFTAGTLGVAGLVGLALPGGAESSPALPPVSAQELLESVAAATPPAMAGTIEVDNALGLPAIPGLPTQLADDATVRVWHDGGERSRISMPADDGEQTIVDDGDTVWTWNPSDRTVTTADHDAALLDEAERQAGEPNADPASIVREILGVVEESSTVSVDGTAEVADRAAYELVLAPAPTERSLLREVRVAVDSETRLPLRLSVYANGAIEPVLSIAFTEFTVGPQDDSLFTFTPPAGSTVVTADEAAKKQQPEDGPAVPEPTLVGEGWDSVLVTQLPAGMLDPRQIEGGDGPGPGGGSETIDPRALLRQFGTPVEGAWGSGVLVSTTVVSVIITDDGRVAGGAVPQQVLIEALSR